MKIKELLIMTNKLTQIDNFFKIKQHRKRKRCKKVDE